jgi:hypothetical protein
LIVAITGYDTSASFRPVRFMATASHLVAEFMGKAVIGQPSRMACAHGGMWNARGLSRQGGAAGSARLLDLRRHRSRWGTCRA